MLCTRCSVKHYADGLATPHTHTMTANGAVSTGDKYRIARDSILGTAVYTLVGVIDRQLQTI